MELSINGQNRAISADPTTPLLYVLRDELGLRATRFGCGEATCGACTVVVDGVARMACDVPVGDLAGTRVETAESLDTDPAPPLLAAFLDHQAAQCGYCLPGILMAATALLRSNPAPDRAQIASALDANLCRCGAHARILDAVESAVARR